ncbi:chemotaxis protein CheX [Cohnella sp. AR92]|uniref:chemotaxis protein CheX n=1 Tax=Cohnella sp. AR92 TaxID=648716 RepID=UPI000F8EBD28|nr:chemotaxis protein CheX [Cohnella sp. AR92]RUS42218.1 chemotaxis protein CheX [Cohnella sp. AR92]
MTTQHIDPFLESASSILGMFQFAPQIGESTKQEKPLTGKEIITVIGVTGHLRGQVYTGMSTDDALRIVSGMMGGASVTEFDDMALSAISELANMICGNAAIHLSQTGVTLDISPPTVITGSGIGVMASKMNMTSVPIHMDGMDGLEICLALEV